MQPTTTPTKFIQIVSSRPAKEVTVEIAPDDSASAVLEKAGLDPTRYWLMKPGDQADYSPTELPYDDISDSSKLHCIPNAVMGIC